MNILHVHSGNLFGGVERFLISLMRYKELGLEVNHEFALCFQGHLSKELLLNGATINLLGEARIRYPWSISRARRNLKRLLEKNKYDMIVCHSSWSQAVFGPVIKSKGLPLVFYLHGPLMSVSWLDKWAAIVPPALIIAVSRHTASTVKRLYPNIPTEVVNCPLPWFDFEVNAAERESIRQRFSISKDTVVIIQVSRMEVRKGHDLLLRALSNLRDLPQWVCWFVGGAQRKKELRYLNFLKKLSVKLGLSERVIIFNEQQEVLPFLKAADIFCQVNRAPEGFGLVFVEALSAGLPVVTVGIGGAVEIINDSCGILISRPLPQEVASVLRRLILDPELRRKMGEAGHARVYDLYDPERQLSRIYEVFKNLLKNSPL